MTTKLRLPKLLAKCEWCSDGSNCHPPELVAWSQARQAWLCSECYMEDEKYDEARDEYVSERPLVFAKDAMDDTDTMERRMIAAMTARRMGVK